MEYPIEASESFHGLLGPEAEPAFLAPEELTASWGRKWGAADEFSTLRSVLMRSPGDGLRGLTSERWSEKHGALVDLPGQRYWIDRTAPDVDLFKEQHAGFVQTLRDHGVEVVLAPTFEQGFTKSIYTRDPLITLPGGAIILRLAPRMRRGEEQSITATVAGAGMPILGTMTGTGLAEGGSFVKLRRDLAAFGTSVRCNVEGHRQLHGMLAEQGVELIEVPLPGYWIHLDGSLLMLDEDLALIMAGELPYTFIEQLHALGIETVEVHPEEDWAVNSFVIGPRKVIMSDDHVRTAEYLNSKYGVEPILIPYSEIRKNGGSLHCSTMELQRDW
ncbi:arginine deiminase family protein [Streptomyces sp. NPDC052042]|uniref:dimethylarginine dimethylaminohydrolase family protein n=1 Tax=Streptomyces sp. NPDC052042 TaxID=3365683 RepID=UPI0037D5852A